MKSAINKKVKGSTMVEVLVAIVIVSIGFGVGLTVYQNVNSTYNHKLKIEGLFHYETVRSQTIMNNVNSSEIIDFENIIVERKMEPYDNNNELIEMSIIVKRFDGKYLFDLKELISEKTSVK